MNDFVEDCIANINERKPYFILFYFIFLLFLTSRDIVRSILL